MKSPFSTSSSWQTHCATRLSFTNPTMSPTNLLAQKDAVAYGVTYGSKKTTTNPYNNFIKTNITIY